MEQLEQMEPSEEGNTITTSLSIKRSTLSKYWCATFFNQDVGTVEQEFANVCAKYIIGNETCPKTGRKHLQCFFAFKSRIRANERYKKLGGHWEATKGSEADNLKYCSKEGDYIKYGLWEADWKFRRSDLNEEQTQIAEIFDVDEDPKFGRKIYWFWESVGGWGKSVLATYFVDQMNAIIVSGAKKDILSGVSSMVVDGKYPKLIVVDIPRCNANSFSIQAIESVKNGMFFNEKYESGMCRFPRPHICIFANEPPDVSQMSADRWVIRNLRGQEDIDKYEESLGKGVCQI